MTLLGMNVNAFRKVIVLSPIQIANGTENMGVNE